MKCAASWGLYISESEQLEALTPFTPLYSLKNHLEIIQIMSTTLQTIRLTEANFREARGMFNPSEQSDIDYVVEGSKRALGNIQHSLAEPEMDLRMLSQLHNYVVKFGLACTMQPGKD